MKLQSSSVLQLRRALWGALVALTLGLTSCTTPDAVTGQSVYNIYTIQDDIKLGQDAMSTNLEELRKQGVRMNADPYRVAQINTIMRRITEASDMPQLPYEITLVHTQVVNACAMPGGQMIVFEGLYDARNGLVRDEDELAAVIAHEIAHVNCRHSTERLSKLMTAGMIAELAAAVAESQDADDWATAIRAIFAVGATLWIPTYTRTDEYEADRVGLFYMARAGYDPRAAPRIWRRVAEEEGGSWGIMSIFATHPANKARYEALEKLVPHAMEEYLAATGQYPPGYTPGQNMAPLDYNFDWRRPDGK